MPPWWKDLPRPMSRAVMVGVARDLDAPLPDRPPPAGLTARVATEEDLPEIAAALAPYGTQVWSLPAGMALADAFRRAYAAGDRCFLGAYGAALAYVGWTRFTDASLAGRGIRIPLHDGEAYGYSVFVLPQFRSQGVASAVGLARLQWLRDRGIRRFYGWIRETNAAMLRIQARLGYRVVARVDQIAWRIKYRVPLLTTITVAPGDPLAEWCGPDRLSLRRGIAIFREGRIPPDSSPR